MTAARLILNAESFTLAGITSYWGAGRHIAPSADGSWFYAFQARDNTGHVVRRWPDGRQELVTLSPQPTTRPTFRTGPSGLFVAAGMDGVDSQLPYIWQIDSYVWPGPAVNTTDQIARTQIAQMQATIGVLATRLNTLEQRPTADPRIKGFLDGLAAAFRALLGL